MQQPEYTVTVNGKEPHKVVLDAAGASTGTLNGEPFAFDLIKDAAGRMHVLHKGRSHNVEILRSDKAAKTLTLLINGRSYDIQVADKFDLLLKSLGMDKASSAKVNELKAPMPGLVLDVVVSEGQEIKKGDALVVLEAMKMENILKAPADATVKKIAVKKGTAVEKNQVLIQFG
ncbi:MAG: biotin/lipoyl-binding protein [Bacteroidia bacterium]|jgi:biotin carboxyl carrier protein|nr:biotin/lipoyl-binding protein [Bacteroidia bacterium]